MLKYIIFFCNFSNGKAVHYNGASLLQWRSVRLDVSIGAGDIAGVGWERNGDGPGQGETPKGKVYFTHNGRRLAAYIDDVSGAMYPVVHIQKKVFDKDLSLYVEYSEHIFVLRAIIIREKLGDKCTQNCYLGS